MSESCVRVDYGNGVAARAFELPGLVGRVWSQPAGGPRGGDLHVLSACSHAMVSRMIVADTAGHGEAATAASDAILDAMREMHHIVDNVSVMQRLNACLPMPGLATAVSATLDAKTGELFYAYAGIPAGFHYDSKSGTWAMLQAVCSIENAPAGLPLGVVENSVYCQSRTQLAIGDRILLTTDGVLDVPSPTGDRPGMDGLLEFLQASNGASTPGEVVDGLIASLSGWAGREDGTVPMHDDVSVVVAERRDDELA